MVSFRDYEYVEFTVNAILVVAFFVTLIRVVSNSKFMFLIKMCTLLIVSNACGIIVLVANKGILDKDYIWIWI
jgi:hypothetical protein